MTREQLLHHLSTKLCSLSPKHTLRVALDGIDAAGKTTLADELAPLIEAQGRPVCHSRQFMAEAAMNFRFWEFPQ